ncbi:CRIM1 [Bugula neritina]|uniref:CRIM1 n=1 Tax=Bugula neritina TaxID=10212 RepID=A0A7J7J4H9_BUGNE|nr:CRIM1 [Bugula neritina]
MPRTFLAAIFVNVKKTAKVTTTPTICFTSAGRTYSSGDSWFDGCHQCYCENGRELCSLINCPLVSCKQPLVKPGDCCPSCPFEAATASTVNISTSCVSTDDQEHLENDVWQLDTCTVCMCLQGDAFCETKRCPPTLCAHPTTRDGECCASCNGEIESQPTTAVGKPCTTLSGVEFDHGSVWKLGDCQSCTCKDGTVTCFSQTCPVLLCKTTVQQKGQCCPKCTAESTYDKICIYEGNWYTHLQTWKDNSLQCTCIHGQSECKTVDCIPCKGDQSKGGDKPHCCLQPTGDNGESFLPTRIGLPMIILFSVLLLAFAVVIALLVVLIVRQRKKHKTKLTAIPKILESRVLQGTQDAATKKRPKSTNLEFLRSTTENRYNTTMSLGDTECCKPLVEKTLSGNEYIQC